MKQARQLLIVMICVSFIFGCGKGGILKDFVSVDRAYIPALWHTRTGEVELSRRAMTVLKERWASFYDRHGGDRADDEEWKGDLVRIHGLIGKADGLVTAGVNLAAAHEQLETVRYVFLEMRRRNKIDYYLDAVTEFHGKLERIQPARGGWFSAKARSRMRDALEVTVEAWDRVEEKEMDIELLGYGKARTEAIRRAREKVTYFIQEAARGLAGADREVIRGSAGRIRPVFMKYFRLFGDFE